MHNIYFDLTEELNAEGPIAVLASGQIRCDFVSRPPRVSLDEVAALFSPSREPDPMLVVGVEPLIRMKQTQRAKDYPVIGELARLLPLPDAHERICEIAERWLPYNPLETGG